MPGFFVSNRRLALEPYDPCPGRCVREALDLPGQTAARCTLDRFMRDKALARTREGFVVLEGYLLNRAQLMARYAAASVPELMSRMYRERGDAFFSAFQGEFSGALYDGAEDKWLIFTSQSGACPVFYADTEQGLFAGSQVQDVLAACRRTGAALHADESAAYQMLTYGFMATDATYAREIRRLRGGTYLRVCRGACRVETYHALRRHPERFARSTQRELIEAVDAAFREAVRLEFDKDAEYGLGHLADLSGGLDSRMTVWVAHAMGYGPIQLMTYGRAGGTDERVARQIARALREAILVYPMSDASFLRDIGEITRKNAGLSLYSGISGGNRMLKAIDMRGFGLEHTGMLGDVVIGSWWRSPRDRARGRQTGRYSSRLAHRLPREVTDALAAFGDDERMLLYTRGFQGAANTFLIRRHYTEVSSPFMHPALMQLCLDIPQAQRDNHRLYRAWILKRYPDAARFIWERTGARITEPEPVSRVRRLLTRGPQKLLRMLGRQAWLGGGMVPMDRWLAQDAPLRGALDRYAQEGFARLPTPLSGQLIADMEWLYATGNADEKTMVLTVLAALALYFGKGEAP